MLVTISYLLVVLVSIDTPAAMHTMSSQPACEEAAKRISSEQLNGFGAHPKAFCVRDYLQK
jgi:hypothetical protein